MIEAMACGTPVIAWRCGSVPEIVEDGVTGFIVDNEEEAITALGKIHHLDRRRIRAAFEQRFTARQMAQNYLKCFKQLIVPASALVARPPTRNSLELQIRTKAQEHFERALAVRAINRQSPGNCAQR